MVAVFREPAAGAIAQLSSFRESEWKRNLLWLDASGLALYLLDRLRSLGCEDVLPPLILARLRENTVDNRARTEALLAEMVLMTDGFDRAGLTFAHLKGMTMPVQSVPDPALRCQLDLDVLIAASDAPAAREVLKRMGYDLHVVSGSIWEFKAGSSMLPSRNDLYKPRPQRSAELHLVDSSTVEASTTEGWLRRAERRSIRGVVMPVLSPADIFLGQAMHLFRHVRSEFTRITWLLEFARHLEARRHDTQFWSEVEALAASLPQAALAIGVSALLAQDLFGVTTPEELKSWTILRVPLAVRLWVDHYGRRALLANFPGSKLYLLLEKELIAEAARGQTAESEVADAKTALRERLVPLRIPRMIVTGESDESLRLKLRRYVAQLRFLLFRFRFHSAASLRYAVEVLRWRRRTEGLLP